MRNCVVWIGLLASSLAIADENVQRTEDSIAYALDAHSGEIRNFSKKDLTRNITVSRT